MVTRRHTPWMFARLGSSILLTAAVAVAIGTSTASAGLVLTGGGLELVEEGQAVAMAGDAAPANLATGASPFALDVINNGGFAAHQIAHINDGLYGNSNSWIGASPGFAGINLGATAITNVQSIAFGRSNVLAGDPCGGGVCTDRHAGMYTLQFTTVANPNETTPDDDWTNIGTLEYGASDGPGTNYNATWQRHRYNFDPVSATGIRLLLGQADTAIDEIELYDMRGPYVEPPPKPSPITITPAAGFDIVWDDNDGDFFDATPPPDGAIVPDNNALAANGATAFSSSDLGLGVHVAANLNDGIYGNSNSWISADADPGPAAFAGIDLGGEFPVNKIAFGRDNGNGAFDDSDPGTDACNGQCDDRWAGIYTLQFTQVDNPDAATTATGDPSTGWADIGTIEYVLSTSDGPGGEFTGFLRHEFAVSSSGQPLSASGVRIVVPTIGLNGGTAIDEIEVYVVPEPASFGLAIFGILALLVRQRRRL